MISEKFPTNNQKGEQEMESVKEYPDKLVVDKVHTKWRAEAQVVEVATVLDHISYLWNKFGDNIDAKKVAESLEELSQKALEMKADIEKELEK